MSNLTLRPPTPEDSGAHSRITNHPDVILNALHVPYRTTREQQEDFAGSGSTHWLAVVLDEQVIGFGKLQIFERRRSHAARADIVIDRCDAQTSAGTVLLDGLIELGERWYGIHRFEARLFAEDEFAVGLFRQAGFLLEATHRRAALRDGAYADSCSLARIND